MMDVIFLGAGKPASGKSPSALKRIARDTRALDWQLHSFRGLAESKFHFVGGYHVDEVVADYPHLNYTVVADWKKRSVLYSLLQAPLGMRSAVVMYADTVFRKSAINKITASQADVAYGVDSQWQARFDDRPEADLAMAELVAFGTGQAEFTGLIHFSKAAAEYIATLDENAIGNSLPALIHHLTAKGYRVEPVDVAGLWAEFNAPEDIARFILGTKAETLRRLARLVCKSHIGKQVVFTAEEWQNEQAIWHKKIADVFAGATLVVRSSARGEDNWNHSNAGGFDSILNVNSSEPSAVTGAVDTVIASYGSHRKHSNDQVLVQEQVSGVRFSGVIFTCGLETGSPYWRINFDDTTSSTASVTDGSGEGLRMFTVSKYKPEAVASLEPKLVPVLTAVQELESLLGFDRLDIEFAVDHSGTVHIFQVRPITVDHSRYEMEDARIRQRVATAEKQFLESQNPSPFVLGACSYFGNMPDWNPAEIIGTRPAPLAYSLYRRLITDDTWAQQRAEYGYRDIRPTPLIHTFAGQPYVDIRASLNSFIPADIPDVIAEKLVNAYLAVLAADTNRHDKIEFDVAFTIWTPNMAATARERLMPHGITEQEIDLLEAALLRLTRQAFLRLDSDIAPVAKLQERAARIEQSDIPLLRKAYLWLDDCRRYGTLPFAHAARAGFVANSFLESFVAEGVISREEKYAFMRSVHTVTAEFEADKQAMKAGKLSLDALVGRFGHLRPGTYDATASAYWEAPERYLVADAKDTDSHKSGFTFSDKATAHIAAVLARMGNPCDVSGFVAYLRQAIQAREGVKFDFSYNLSRALDAFILYGAEIGLSRSQITLLEYADFERCLLAGTHTDMLEELLQIRQQEALLTDLVELPHLLLEPRDFYAFEKCASLPNFVTTQMVEAPAKHLTSGNAQDDLDGKIIMIAQADPGYDWLFGHKIAGLITQYGGANSHMAIRSAELGLPAAIGVGDKLFERLSRTTRIYLDCGNKIVRGV